MEIGIKLQIRRRWKQSGAGTARREQIVDEIDSGRMKDNPEVGCPQIARVNRPYRSLTGTGSVGGLRTSWRFL